MENVIQGDVSPTDLPKTQMDEGLLNQEKKKAKLAKSKDFAEIREYWEARRTFFQQFTPGGTELRFTIPNKDIAQQWVLANNIIAEINAFLSQYDQALEVVKQVEDVQR